MSIDTYDVRVLADSLNPHYDRLTTLQVTFPRFILAEVNTHRMLSRNSASSRAIPPEKQIQRVIDHPFVPETFNKRVTGMGVGEALDDEDMEAARRNWLGARDDVVEAAQALVDLDCDKSRINRLLEPFLWHTAIISATEWSNFFALRDHPAAQPEFQIIARMMREVMEQSEPEMVEFGDWHRPLVDRSEPQTPPWAIISAGRCARVSYDTHENYESPQASEDRALRLKNSGHFSPFEHVATPGVEGFHANYRGWIQLRRSLPGESDFSVIRRQETSGT